jgi:hypothetical protein
MEKFRKTFWDFYRSWCGFLFMLLLFSILFGFFFECMDWSNVKDYCFQNRMWTLPMSICVSVAVIPFLLGYVGELLELRGDGVKVADYLGPAVVGLLELVGYIVCITIERPDGIAAWLAFKGLAVWSRWSASSKTGGCQSSALEEQLHGRRVFHRFCIGNLLNVGAAALICWLVLGA